MDDTPVLQKTVHKMKFLEHISSIDPYIQFTAEEARPYGCMPFLDTLVMPEPDRTLSTTVCRKPTHTDQYLHWDSHHNFAPKYSIINTLTHRVWTVSSNAQLLQTEVTPKWGITKVQVSHLGTQYFEDEE